MKGKRQAIFKIVTAMFIFGTIGLFVRSIKLPSSMIACARGIIGMIFLMLLVRLKGKKFSFNDIKHNWIFLLLSGICLGLNWMFLFEAYNYTTVAKATLCYYLAPVFVLMISPVVLKETLTLKRAGSIFFALLGMVFISDLNGLSHIQNTEWKGILFGIAAAILYASVILLNKKMEQITAYDMTIVQLFISAMIMLPYTLITTDLTQLNVSLKGMILLIVVGIVHTGIAYALYFGATKYLKAQSVALLGYIDPAVAILLSAILLHEKLGIYGCIGAVMILGSTMIGEIKLPRNK